MASKIAGLDYRAFLEEMKKHGVHYPYDEEELERDLTAAKKFVSGGSPNREERLTEKYMKNIKNQKQ